MASKLTRWINAQLKAKGLSVKEAKKNAGKYKSIAAAKRAGSLYYTDKKGRIMIAAYAEDLKTSPPPKKRPTKKKKESAAPKTSAAPPKRPTRKKTETKKIDTVAKKPNSKTPDESSGGRAKVTSTTTTVVRGRPEAAKALDNLSKAVAKFRIKKADTKATERDSARKIVQKMEERKKDQDALDRALRMDNKEERERDARRAGNKRDTRTRIEKEADLLEQERKKRYKRGVATKRAKGGLIDMRKTGLFR